MDYHLPAIGTLHTVFKEKFGVPRQSGMMSEAKGVLKLQPDPKFRAALSRLEAFSHLWIVFVFHKAGGAWHPIVDPPRDTEFKNIGVFASRSPHRPNPIGLSGVKLESIDYDAVGGIEIHVSGVDILDGTPVLDIKPYLPYADRIEGANSGWTVEDSTKLPVTFSDESAQALSRAGGLHAKGLIHQMLERDPRPASQRRAVPIGDPGSEGRPFAFRVLDFDVKWEIRGGGAHVKELVLLERTNRGDFQDKAL